MPNTEDLLTVEDRLEAAESRCTVLLPLLNLRDTVQVHVVYAFIEDTAHDIRCIEAALARTEWGQRALATVAPDVPEDGR